MQGKRRLAYASVLLSAGLLCASLTSAEINFPNKSTEQEKQSEAPTTLDEDWGDEPEVSNTNIDLPISQIRKFIETFQIVKSGYVANVTDDELFENAIHGLLENLDPYSRYLDADHYQQLLEFTEGQIAKPSFGLKFDPLQNVWRIDKVIPNSEAYRAGLRNDQIVERLNHIRLKALEVKSVDQLLVGALGSLIELDVKVENSIKKIESLRDQKVEYSVEPYLTDENILVLKIQAFQKETVQQVLEAIKTYQSQIILRGILIDVRDNPGGLLSASVDLADLFLEEGLIVSTKGRLEPVQRFQALPSENPIHLPIAILQNRYSASAAEVFTAALKEQNRAVVIGERSYGKGAIQKLFPLEQGALQMTVAHYYTPQGHVIEGKGIEPQEFLPILPSHTQEEILAQAVKLFHQLIVMPKP